MRERRRFLKDSFASKKGPVFQVLLLDNSEDDTVEVQEAKQVNFRQVKQHLRSGGSVFITSKDSQKVSYPRESMRASYIRSRRNYGILFRQHLKSS